MIRPDFFIAGAPKCGTTALYRYLESHPQIRLADYKEPGFWADDFAGVRRSRPMPLRDLNDYLQLFGSPSSGLRAVGEGSTMYLASESALTNIHAFNPTSRIVVMLRNPLEFVPSFHRELLFARNEMESEFETAWDLQLQRAEGGQVPSSCREPEFLQYAKMGRLGHQVERMWDIFPRHQTHVMFFEDFKSDPGRTYRGLLEFLQVDDDHRNHFPRINVAKELRFAWMHDLYHRHQGALGALVRWGRRWGRQIGPLKRLWRQISRRTASNVPCLDTRMRERLLDAFADDIQLLARLTNRDLRHWSA